MIATVERPVKAVKAITRREQDGAAARELALAYLRYASACWRGEERAARFATRLSAYRRATLSPMPRRTSDAFSPHGAGGRGIAWYQTADAVLGFVPGRRYGYRVPLDAVPLLARCVPTGPGERALDAVDALRATGGRAASYGAVA